MYFIVSHFYHEPPAREIGQPLPVHLTVNKLYSYLHLYLLKDEYSVENLRSFKSFNIYYGYIISSTT